MSCRACLVQRRKMRPLTLRVRASDLTYADLLRSCANVKIHANDGFTDEICGLCRSKAEEAYEFKLLVEQSDKTLWLAKNTLDDVTDIKVEIEGSKLENILNSNTDDINNIRLDFENGTDQLFYKNSSIQKLNKTEARDNYSNTQPEIHVEDFLNTIVKKEVKDNEIEEDDFCQDDWINQADSDDEYLPSGVCKKKSLEKSKHEKKKKIRKGVKTVKNNRTFPEIGLTDPDLLEDVSLAKRLQMMKKTKGKIKPVILNDYCLVRAKQTRRVGSRKEKSCSSLLCPYCGIVYTNIKNHLLTHTGKRDHKCNICSKAYFTIHQLEHHMKKHGERNYKCDKCIAAFYIKASLKSHMKCHQDLKDFVCNICSKAFKRKATLRRHVFRHSFANKTIKCELCNMTFFEMPFLRHHMRVHTGERPFNCELCSQPYSYGRDFIRHCLKKHGCRFRGSEVRVMTEEVLQQYRARARDEQEQQRSAAAVDSILPPTVTMDPAAIQF